MHATAGAEALIDRDTLRGAEAPLFHVTARHVTARLRQRPRTARRIAELELQN